MAAADQGKVVYRGRYVTVSFKLDRKGIQAIALGGELRDACHRAVVERALPYAVSISPKSTKRHRHYAESFAVDDVLTGLSPEAIGDPPMLRVGTRLVNQVRHAVFVEFGGKNYRGYRVLGRTVDYLNGTGGGKHN